MFCNERYDKLLEILSKRTSASVRYLANELHVSEPTIRRDLRVLSNENRIKRTFGGAIINADFNAEVPLVLRETVNQKTKEQIAREAVRFIQDDFVIFMDASSTVAQIIKHLSGFKNLTIITNSPKHSLRLAELKIKSFSTGGEMLENSVAYVGAIAQQVVEQFNADLFFFSCRGLSSQGMLTDGSIEETEIRKAMMRHAKRSVFLCSSDKFGKEYMYNLCSYKEVDAIVSDGDWNFAEA